jgi:hypothetical protein
MLAPVAAAMLLLAACGGSDDKDNASQSNSGTDSGSTSASAAPSSDSMAGMDMSTPMATSTPEALAAGTYEGTFSNVADAPAGSKAVGGTATMTTTKNGATFEIAATGLNPKAVYVAHVHKDACSQDEGGTHFQFTPGGEAKPPNEIWLTPTVSSSGKGTAKTSVDKPVNSDAKSVVIHQKRAEGETTDAAKPPKVACADLAKK